MRLLIVIGFLLATPRLALAQFPADVQAGTRVRVWIPEHARQNEGPYRRQLLRGNIESVDALMNDPRRRGGPHYKRDWRAAGVGASWGAGIGAVIGLIFPHESWRRVIH